MSDKVREQFDAWWVAEYESHTYQHADAYNMAWEGWEASRRAALEAGADSLSDAFAIPCGEGDEDFNAGVAYCVQALRRLAQGGRT